MITSLEGELMLEMANNIETGDELDYIMGDDGRGIHPEDFDNNSGEEAIMSLIDILANNNRV